MKGLKMNGDPYMASFAIWYLVGAVVAIALILTFIMQYLYTKDPLGKLHKKEK